MATNDWERFWEREREREEAKKNEKYSFLNINGNIYLYTDYEDEERKD